MLFIYWWNIIYTRKHCSYNIAGLRKVIPEALATVSREDIQKFYVKINDYCKAYRDGKKGKDVDVAIKEYKSHRKVTNVNK